MSAILIIYFIFIVLFILISIVFENRRIKNKNIHCCVNKLTNEHYDKKDSIFKAIDKLSVDVRFEGKYSKIKSSGLLKEWMERIIDEGEYFTTSYIKHSWLRNDEFAIRYKNDDILVDFGFNSVRLYYKGLSLSFELNQYERKCFWSMDMYNLLKFYLPQKQEHPLKDELDSIKYFTRTFDKDKDLKFYEIENDNKKIKICEEYFILSNNCLSDLYSFVHLDVDKDKIRRSARFRDYSDEMWTRLLSKLNTTLNLNTIRYKIDNEVFSITSVYEVLALQSDLTALYMKFDEKRRENERLEKEKYIMDKF